MAKEVRPTLMAEAIDRLARVLRKRREASLTPKEVVTEWSETCGRSETKGGVTYQM